MHWVFFLCRWVKFWWGYWKSRYVSPQVNEKKKSVKMNFITVCLLYWVPEELLENTLQSKILPVNKISIFLFKKRKIIIVPTLFQQYALCVYSYMQQFVWNEHYSLKSQFQRKMYVYGCVQPVWNKYWLLDLYFEVMISVQSVYIIVCNSLCEINVTRWSHDFNACLLTYKICQLKNI